MAQLSEFFNVGDFERAAAEKLEPGVWGYFAGGAGDEVTLADNVAAWQRWRLRPRVLAGLSEWRTGIRLFEADLTMPVLVAPIAYQALVDREGEAAMARAASAAGTVMCLSTLATARPADLAAAAPQGRHWFQLYCFKDAGVTQALMDEAVDCGFQAIVVTVDAPRGGSSDWSSKPRLASCPDWLVSNRVASEPPGGSAAIRPRVRPVPFAHAAYMGDSRTSRRPDPHDRRSRIRRHRRP